MPRVLIAGCGYVGSKLARELQAAGHEVYALRREASKREGIEGVSMLSADLTAPSTLELPDVDVAFFTAAPDTSDEKAYRSIYVDGSRNLRNALGARARLFFTSSTAVYGQNDGSEVDESSDTLPESFRGRVLLEAERDADVVLRLGGIDGPGRTRPLERLRSGEARSHPGHYLNLIHRDDASGALIHLMLLESPEQVYIGVDREPVDSEVFYRWLAESTGYPSSLADPRRAAKNKRCSSARLIESGYQLRYPTFREGYRELIARVRSRRLEPCPRSPNCVSSRAPDESRRMAPLHFTGSSREAAEAIVQAVEALAGRVVEADDGYVRCEFTTRVFGFVDDVEWVIETNGGGDTIRARIDFRSASRVGYWDFGVNRRRLRKIIRRLSRGGKISPVSGNT